MLFVQTMAARAKKGRPGSLIAQMPTKSLMVGCICAHHLHFFHNAKVSEMLRPHSTHSFTMTQNCIVMQF
jgi:hypothetical protein